MATEEQMGTVHGHEKKWLGESAVVPCGVVQGGAVWDRA